MKLIKSIMIATICLAIFLPTTLHADMDWDYYWTTKNALIEERSQLLDLQKELENTRDKLEVVRDWSLTTISWSIFVADGDWAKYANDIGQGAVAAINIAKGLRFIDFNVDDIVSLSEFYDNYGHHNRFSVMIQSLRDIYALNAEIGNVQDDIDYINDQITELTNKWNNQ